MLYKFKVAKFYNNSPIKTIIAIEFRYNEAFIFYKYKGFEHSIFNKSLRSFYVI